MTSPITRFFDTVVLGRPKLVLAFIALATAFFGYQMQHFKLDASSDSLVLDDDKDLRYYQKIKRAYGSDDYLIITFTPKGPLFSETALSELAALVAEIDEMERVGNVVSILSVPLFQSPKVPFYALATGYKTLQKEGVDIELAKTELTRSPLYRNFLISEDGKTTGIQVNFVKDEAYEALVNRREDLRAKKYEEGLTEEERLELAEVEADHRVSYTRTSEVWREDVARVRRILSRHEDAGQLYLGGIPMIVADMIAFVRNDIEVFGLGVLAFLVLVLSVIFRKPRWVLLPMLTCVLTGVVMIGYLGWADWRATVISSNFSSLLFIITMSMAIHIVVRYRELHAANPDTSHRDLVFQAGCLVARPCLYCALTTMVGFGSLIVSGIRPVIDFGLMMAFGIGVAYVLCFLFLPAALVLLPKTEPAQLKTGKLALTSIFARIADRHGRLVIGTALVLVVLGAVGITRLTVENKFIDYFKKSTEIYQGMRVIDEQLGGTTPLEIILDGEGKDYWFEPENMAKLRQIHDYLDSLPETGKVLSLDTMIRVVEEINDGKPVNRMILGLVRQFLPETMKKEVLRPYVSDDFDQARIAVRVQESNPDLRREALLTKIAGFLEGEMGIDSEGYRLTGMYVLYNNMLQSLFRSQILTIGMVFLATWIMFVILFRSFVLASIAIVPNIFPVALVLGTLGWAGIPLDMMTITIAAITIGIAVDHTIHYIHRFKLEYPETGDYTACMHRCHGSIGKAMYYTAITIIFGFSILALSNFIPTIYFGLFTGVAMVAALLASLTLLPRLLILLKPLS